MTVALNHTIVWCRDKDASAAFLTHVLGLPPARAWGPFQIVEVEGGVSLDFHDTDGPVASQHYAFLVGDDDFDDIFGRIRAESIPYWADPGLQRSGEINRRDGGRGLYFEDPDGHVLEILTRPYGSEER
jgi:catechol 2,3-dioxygenase-like lactoylglutathione lyase family enzyme